MRLIRLAVILVVSLVLSPLAAAQQERKAQRIGLLAPRSASDALPFNEAFRQRLSELGWVEGQSIVIEYRFAEGKRRPNTLNVATAILSKNLCVPTGVTMADRSFEFHGLLAPHAA
jgi:Fe2+ transport system protein FeoA